MNPSFGMSSVPQELLLFRQIHKLMEISNQFFQRGYFAPLREHLHVRHGEFVALMHLYNLTLDKPEGISLKRLTRSLHINQPAASMLVSHLVKKGCVSRRENPRDRRQALLTIAPSERAAFDQMARAQSAAAERVLHRLSEGRRELLMDFVDVMYNELADRDNESGSTTV